MQDPFTSPAFNMTELTAAINILPNQWGRMNEMGLFVDRGVRTRTILVEERNGVLNLLQSQPVGSPGQVSRNSTRGVRGFAIPHIPLDDAVMPEDVQGIRAFGSQTEAESVAMIVNERLITMRAKHDITREHLRMGALKGLILDADGSTMFNLFTEFNVSEKTVDFTLGTAGTVVSGKCREVVRHIEDNLLGEVSTGVHALVSPEFYDKLIAHAKVEAAYAGWAGAADRLGGDLRKGFTFGGITFEEYRGQATDASANVRKFIAAQEGRAFPLGTRNSFFTANAPADFNETVNTMGLPFYSKSEPRKFGRGQDLHTQSNPLPLCTRPAVLVKIHTSN
jgi:hypothetical protein